MSPIFPVGTESTQTEIWIPDPPECPSRYLSLIHICIYSLSPYTLEEVVARNYLIGERPDAILNLVDGTNIERNLYLSTQLMELGIPVVMAVNMIDIVNKNGDKINVAKLEMCIRDSMQADYLPKYFQDNNAGKHQDTDPMTADYRSFYAFRIGDHYIDCMDLADQIEIADRCV